MEALSTLCANEAHMLFTAVFAGFLTWVTLHRNEIPGDVGAASLLASYGILYSAIRILGTTASSGLHLALSLTGAYLCSALLCTAAYRLSPWHPLAHYPGPWMWRISSLWLTYISYKGRRHLILDRLHARYGPFLRIGPNVLSVNSLSAQYIYSAAAGMPKSESYRAPGHAGVTALFFKQPTEKIHSDRKRIWSGMFTKEGIDQIAPYLEKRTFELIECIERRQGESPDGHVDIAECIYHWSYDLMENIVFGGCNRLEMMQKGDPKDMIHGGKIATVLLDSFGQTPWLLDIVWRIPVGAAMHRLANYAAEMMERRLQIKEPPAFRDLASYLTEDESIPLRDLNLEAVVAIQGGSDNTSITIALALYFLTTEPRYYTQLRAELDRVFPDPTGPLSADALAHVPFLEAVVNEALRLGSPYFLPRVVPAGGARIDDKFIPEGTVVAQAAYSQQVDPSNFYPDPLNFRPERWLPNGLGPDTRASKSALSSFSWGPHVCIARQLAYQEMRHLLARLVLTLDITPEPSFDPVAFRDGILNMRTTILEKPFRGRVKRRPGVCF